MAEAGWQAEAVGEAKIEEAEMIFGRGDIWRGKDDTWERRYIQKRQNNIALLGLSSSPTILSAATSNVKSSSCSF